MTFLIIHLMALALFGFSSIYAGREAFRHTDILEAACFGFMAVIFGCFMLHNLLRTIEIVYRRLKDNYWEREL